MDKEARLKLLREIGRKHREKEEIQFAGLPPGKQDIQEEVGSMDSFVERTRETSRPLTSDEC